MIETNLVLELCDVSQISFTEEEFAKLGKVRT